MVTAITMMAMNASRPPTNGTIGSSVNALRIADCLRSGLGAPPGPWTLEPEHLLAGRPPLRDLEGHEVDEHQHAGEQAGDQMFDQRVTW